MLSQPNWKNEFTKAEITFIVNCLRDSNMIPCETFYIRYDGRYDYYFLEVFKGNIRQSIMLTDKRVHNTARLTKQLEDYLK